jgi:hypothetical protein
VSHPSLGLPPRSLQAGFPDAAARLRTNRAALAVRALEVAADADPTLRTRYDEAGLRNLLRDAMDDVVRLCEGLRSAARGLLSAEEMVPADLALDEAVKVYRWYRRLSGDARKRNRIVDAIYKGI